MLKLSPLVLVSLLDACARSESQVGLLLGSSNHIRHSLPSLSPESTLDSLGLHAQLYPTDAVLGIYSLGPLDLSIFEHSLLPQEPLWIRLDLETLQLECFLLEFTGAGHLPTPVHLETRASAFDQKALGFVAQEDPMDVQSLLASLDRLVSFIDHSLVNEYFYSHTQSLPQKDASLGRHLLSTLQSMPILDPALLQSLLAAHETESLLVKELSRVTRECLTLSAKLLA